MGSDKERAMQAIHDEIMELRQSPLYELRQSEGYTPVIGEGSLDAPVVFIGEAPGQKEAESGRPFVGASGKVLAELLQSIGLTRKEVYITNVVKDRPPNNRDPQLSSSGCLCRGRRSLVYMASRLPSRRRWAN